MKKCKECGDEFEPLNPKGLFCSEKCKQRDYRKRISEMLKIARGGMTRSELIKDMKPSVRKEVIDIPIKEFGKRPKNLLELKLLCPKELTGLDRSQWIAKERQKYNL